MKNLILLKILQRQLDPVSTLSLKAPVNTYHLGPTCDQSNCLTLFIVGLDFKGCKLTQLNF